MASSTCQVLAVAVTMGAMAATSEAVYAQVANASGAQRSAHVFVSNGAKVRRLGGARSLLQFGVGIDWRHPRGFGLGIEAGPRFEDYQFTRFDDLMLSVDVSYHARPRSKATRVIPFMDGGFSLGWEPVPDGQRTSFVSVGGGVTYWLNAQRGILFEVRDAVTLDEPLTGYHDVGVRVGYTWLMARK